MIEITHLDPREVVKAVYRRSFPVGIGYVHYREGELDEKTIDEIIQEGEESPSRRNVISMDYVHGRQCKFHAFRRGEKVVVNDNWLDHALSDLHEMIDELNDNFAKKLIADTREKLGEDLGGFSKKDLLADNMPVSLDYIDTILERIGEK